MIYINKMFLSFTMVAAFCVEVTQWWGWGSQPHRGSQLPMWLHFVKCVCQNKRTGTSRAHATCAPWIRQWEQQDVVKYDLIDL